MVESVGLSIVYLDCDVGKTKDTRKFAGDVARFI
jgi:hypothetical protein